MMYRHPDHHLAWPRRLRRTLYRSLGLLLLLLLCVALLRR